MSTERKLVGAEETLSTERRDGSGIDCVNRRKQRGRRVVCPQKKGGGVGAEETLSTERRRDGARKDFVHVKKGWE